MSRLLRKLIVGRSGRCECVDGRDSFEVYTLSEAVQDEKLVYRVHYDQLSHQWLNVPTAVSVGFA